MMRSLKVIEDYCLASEKNKKLRLLQDCFKITVWIVGDTSGFDTCNFEQHQTFELYLPPYLYRQRGKYSSKFSCWPKF